MLEQNLNDKCFSMANIFSFAEKVIPDFKNKSEGEKFLFLYCITAKLLSNRLYDFESAADKINCLLDRITKSKDKEDKKENVEQLKKSLETFIGEKDFSVEKVKSFFDTNKNLLTSIYRNEKPADLLLFFVQMQSKNIFKEEKNKYFVHEMKFDIAVKFTVYNAMGYNAQEQYRDHLIYYGQTDICKLNNRSVSKSKIHTTLKKDPNRIFNEYLTELDKEVGLDIFDKNIKEYERGFKLFGREENYEQEKRNIYVNQTLDIDKILKEKFGFKKIKEISKDELKNLTLSYDEEFIYFLASNDFSNEYAFQHSACFGGPFSFTMPENIKPEITLKIYDYFVRLGHQSLINTSIKYLRNKFETSKDLLNAYDKLKDSLSFKENELLKIFIGDPLQIKQVLKCQDTKKPEEIKKLLEECQPSEIIDCFLSDDKNKRVLEEFILGHSKILPGELSYINKKLVYLKKNLKKDNNENKLKKLQELMRSFFKLEKANNLNLLDAYIKNDDNDESHCGAVLDYYLDNDEGKDDDKNKSVLKEFILAHDKILPGGLSYINQKFAKFKKNLKPDNNENKLKKLQDLMRSFFDLRNAAKLLNAYIKNDDLLKSHLKAVFDYYLDNDEDKDVLCANMYSSVEKSKDYFEEICSRWTKLQNANNKTKEDNEQIKKLEYLITKFLWDGLKNDEKFIDYTIDMFKLQEKFCMWDLNEKKEMDVTDELKKLLTELIDKNLGLVENKNNIVTSDKYNEKKENEQIIVKFNVKSYDLAKIYYFPSQSISYEKYCEKNKYNIGDPVKDLQKKIELQKKILGSKVISQETKQTIYFLAKRYKEYLKQTYDDFEKLSKSKFDEAIKTVSDNFLAQLEINQETYDRLKNADKNDAQEMKNRKIYLEKKANVTNFDYLNENWTTWLSFLLIVPIFLYNFKWKPEYENKISQLNTDLKHKRQIDKVETAKRQLENNFYSDENESESNNFIDEIDEIDEDENEPESNNFIDEIDENEDYKFKLGINIVAYKFSKNGKNHESMMEEMNKFVKQYEKDFEPKLDNEIPLMEKKNMITTNSLDKN